MRMQLLYCVGDHLFELSALQNQTILQLCDPTRTCVGNHAKLQTLLGFWETGCSGNSAVPQTRCSTARSHRCGREPMQLLYYIYTPIGDLVSISVKFEISTLQNQTILHPHPHPHLRRQPWIRIGETANFVAFPRDYV